MKFILRKQTIRIFIIVFVLLTLITIRIERPSDGNDYIGFPFNFYTILGGKRINPVESVNVFNTFYLFIDIVIFWLISMILSYLTDKMRSVSDQKQ